MSVDDCIMSPLILGYHALYLYICFAIVAIATTDCRQAGTACVSVFLVT